MNAAIALCQHTEKLQDEKDSRPATDLQADTSEPAIRKRAAAFGFERTLTEDGGYGVFKTPAKLAAEKLSERLAKKNKDLQISLENQTKEVQRACALVQKQDSLLDRAKNALAAGPTKPIRTGLLSLHSWHCNHCQNWNAPSFKKCLNSECKQPKGSGCITQYGGSMPSGYCDKKTK